MRDVSGPIATRSLPGVWGSPSDIIRLREEVKQMTDKWEIYEDAQGNWRWRRVAANGRIVGASTESYRSRSDCVASARRNGYGGN